MPRSLLFSRGSQSRAGGVYPRLTEPRGRTGRPCRIGSLGQPGTPPCDMGQDINGDGTVNVVDLIELLLVFGTACP